MPEPSTFTFNVSAAAAAPQTQNPAPAKIGTTGQGVAPSVSVAPGGNFSAGSASRTIQSLFKLGSDVLAPKIEAERRRLAMDGMVAALQGISAEQIKDEEILGGIFGDSSAVSAARQVEKIDAVNKLGRTLAQNESATVQMSPEEYRTWLPQQMQGILTGDEGTDSLITQAFTEQLPGLVDQQVKAHANFRQERARKAWQDSVSTAAALSSDRATQVAQGKLTPDLSLQADANYISALRGPQGISAKEYPKFVNAHYKRALAEGNIRAAELIEASGLLQATQADEDWPNLIKAKDDAIDKRALTSAEGFAFAADEGQLTAALRDGASPFSSVDGLLRHLQQRNAESLDATGRPQYNTDDVNRLSRFFIEGQIAARERAQRARERAAASNSNSSKEAKLAHDALLFAKRLAAGTPHGANLGISREAQALGQQVLWEKWAEADPAKLFATASAGDKWPMIENMVEPLRIALTGGKASSQTRAALGVVASLREHGGQQAVMKYLGDEVGNAALTLLKQEGANLTDERLAEVLPHFNPDAVRLRANIDPTGKVVKEAIADAMPGFINTIFGSPLNAVQPSALGQQLLEEQVSIRAGQLYSRGIDREAAIDEALKSTLNDTVMVGGVPATMPLGMSKTSRRFPEAVADLGGTDHAALDPNGDVWQNAQNLLIEKRLEANYPEFSRGDWTVRNAVNLGAGSLVVRGSLGNGQEFSVQITPEQMRNALSTVSEDRRKIDLERLKTLPGFGIPR